MSASFDPQYDTEVCIYPARGEPMVAEGVAALGKNRLTQRVVNRAHPALRAKRSIMRVALEPHRATIQGVNGGPIRVSRSRVLVSHATRAKVSDFSVIFLIQV